MQNTSKQYDVVVEECSSLFIKKMSDYGSAWRILRHPSLTDHICIKAQRMRQLQENTERMVDEGEKSEFIGIINYSIMALIQLEIDKDDIITIEFNYSDGSRDAECLLSDPITSNLYIVSKREMNARLYELKFPFNYKNTNIFEFKSEFIFGNNPDINYTERLLDKVQE